MSESNWQSSSTAVAQTFSHHPAIPPPVKVRLHVFEEHACSYLPGRIAQMRGLLASNAAPEVYHSFMDAGFRRSGGLIYQPVCRACRQCRPIRVPVARFNPNKAQRRVRKRNQDLHVTCAAPLADDETFTLYERYTTQWHGTSDEESQGTRRRAFEAFLCDSPVDSLEFRYRDSDGHLLAVGICDRSAESLSSVYFYFDPCAADRSPGTYGAIYELDFARERKISYYYLGYWVSACPTMSYKANFRPFELLDGDGRWREGG